MVITSSPLLNNNGFPYLFHQAIAQKIIEKITLLVIKAFRTRIYSLQSTIKFY
jgi:hypothetical protein